MNINKQLLLSSITLSIYIFSGCQSEINSFEKETLSNINRDFKWELPNGVIPPRVPESNPMSSDKVKLGRFLFYDKKLSGNETFSCSSCHFQEFAFADKNKVGIGSTGEFNIRNPQHLTNSAYYTTLSWANPAIGTLERFIILPLTGDSPIEMGVIDKETEQKVLARFETNETYINMFNLAFPNDPRITLDNIVKALATFIRTMNSFNSPYDRYTRGERDAMSEAQKRGMNIFFGEKAECFHCHDGENFSDSTANEKSFFIEQNFHNIGLYKRYKDGNGGLFENSQNESDHGKFRVPSLRNVEVTAPYMHDGSMATLDEIIDLHSNGGRGDGIQNPNLDPLISAKKFTVDEKADLIEFLKSLTDQELLTNQKLSNPFINKSEN